MADYCTICGKNLAMVGRAHHCVPKAPVHTVAAEAQAEPAVESEPHVVSVTNSKPIAAYSAAANTDDAANASYRRWRYRDVDKRRAYMRAYMAERRKAVPLKAGARP